MSEGKLAETESMFADRESILRALEKLNADIGFVPDHSGTIHDLYAQMIAGGVRPEDNAASREMIALRYPEEGK